MEKIYFNSGSPTVTLSWKLREKSGAAVDFTGVTTALWIVGNGDKVLVESSASSGVVTATVPTTLTAGVYGLAIKWLDGWTCCKEEVEKAFEVVSTSGEATVTGDTATFTYDSIISKCDYDELSDYEKQVLRGNTSKSESGWLGASSGSYEDLTDKPTKLSDFENDVPYAKRTYGATADRPVGAHEVEGETVGELVATDLGFCYFDTTLGLPIWVKAIDGSTGEVTWVDATGADPDTPAQVENSTE